MTSNKNEEEIPKPNENLEIPKWINKKYFAEIMEKVVPDYKSIIKWTPTAATAPDEDDSSINARVIIDVELQDGSVQQISYILRTASNACQPDSPFFNSTNLFPNKNKMYAHYIPKFEKKSGAEVKSEPTCLHTEETPENITLVNEDLKSEKFGDNDGAEVKLEPKCLHTEETPENITLVNEDLKSEKFGDIDRLKGVDMENITHVAAGESRRASF